MRRAFPDSYCAVANEGTEYISFPYCTGRVAPGVFVWFGYDPVRSVTFSRGPMAAAEGNQASGARLHGLSVSRGSGS